MCCSYEAREDDSLPGRLQRSGVSERMSRTLDDMARSLPKLLAGMAGSSNIHTWQSLTVRHTR